MTQSVKGQSRAVALEKVAAFKALMTSPDEVVSDLRALGETAALAGVSKFPARIKCATLAWNTLAEALGDDQSA
jgi:nitrogen fixation NifU-like protein